ncbi:MAG: ATP-binding protein [Parasphingorhabdus sp.]
MARDWSIRFLWLLSLIGFWAVSEPLDAQDITSINQFEMQITKAGKVMRFRDADVSFSETSKSSNAGWNRRKLPALWLSDEARQVQEGDLSVRAKVRFDGQVFEKDTISIFTQNNRERISVSINGTSIFRNYTDDRHAMLGWNHPYLIPVSNSLLRPGANEIVIRAESGRNHSLGIGTIAVGAHNALGSHFDNQYLLRIDAPKTLNWIMLLLSVFVFVMWMGRRQEMELLWLSLTGLFWFTRNYHFFAETVPMEPLLFQQITYYSIYFAVAVTLAFCAEFLKLHRRKLIIITMLGIGVSLSLIRLLLTLTDRTDLISSLLTIALFGFFLIILAHHTWKSRSAESWLLFILLSAASLTGVHDIGRIPNIDWWNGAGFHFQPYIGFFLFLVFMLSLARRFLSALSLVEETNLHLEKSVNEATDALAASQQAQRQMEVERALEIERERLMREMHDGIGSSLMTALAVARRRKDPASTIATLQRALSDLKITVDSLAPIEGDVVTLLANLRHRMEQELAQAGITSIWQVEDCAPLEWMDAGHSLHLLRLLQEAISNVLQHADARFLTLSCKSSVLDDQAGVLISIIDDGIGFNPGERNSSKGLGFMNQRAAILNGKLTIADSESGGTAVNLWLAREPVSRG